MEGKVFLALLADGTEKVLGDAGEMSQEQFVVGRWVDFEDPAVRDAEWGAWEAEEIEEPLSA
jgi:hypothetical protein